MAREYEDLVKAALVASAALVVPLAAWAETPKYKADVPASVTTPDVVETERLGTLRFFDGVPDADTVQSAYANLDFMRGVETFLNGIPATSIHALCRGLEDAGVGPFVVGIFETLMDARSLFLTANSSTVYVTTCMDLKDGPVVMEVPPGVLGPVDDAFFRWVTDLGVTGPDQGRGGRYLFVGPNYDGELPTQGFHVVHSDTYVNWLLMRAFVTDSGTEGAVAGVKAAMRVYPLSEAASPPEQAFVNISGVQMNTIHANDVSFFDELNAVVQHEPADAFPAELVGLFASIGIKKGEKFEPDERMRRILSEAVAVGNATARAIAYRPRGQKAYFYEDRQWYSPFAGGSYRFMNNGEQVLDDRTFFHYAATGITPAMAAPQVGSGSVYAFTAHDSEARYLDGGKTYSVTLPAPVPVNNFWSFMVYDNQHRSMLETDQKLAGLDSNNPAIVANDDGSYTVWFGPKPPKGKEGNWIQTMPEKGYSVLLRLYGPLEPWFDKSWKPGDFERVD
ncbi:MAG TPA: DUF1254 domain-containing protein [Rhodospirillales bacterium]|nr:DUF1254 domain-containing protein [Rhodospirillales bacterium]